MGKLAIVKSFFGFGPTKDNPANKLLDAFINTGDALFHTDEEKAANRAKSRDVQLDFIKTQHSENSLRSVARREISLLIIRSYVAMVWLTAVAYVCGDTKKAEFLFKLATVSFSTAVLMVLGFYFGGYYLPKIMGKKS